MPTRPEIRQISSRIALVGFEPVSGGLKQTTAPLVCTHKMSPQHSDTYVSVTHSGRITEAHAAVPARSFAAAALARRCACADLAANAGCPDSRRTACHTRCAPVTCPRLYNHTPVCTNSQKTSAVVFFMRSAQHRRLTVGFSYMQANSHRSRATFAQAKCRARSSPSWSPST